MSQLPPPPDQPGYGYQPQMPPPDHPQATLSLILGILGLVVCQLISPFAWRLGKRVVHEIDASGGRQGGRGLANAGYITGLIGTIILAVGLFAGFVFLVVLIIAGISSA